MKHREEHAGWRAQRTAASSRCRSTWTSSRGWPREYIAPALEAERRAYLVDHADLLDGDGRRLVVGHGHGRRRELTTAASAVEVRAPRVRDRREGERSVSALLPPYLRRSPKVGAVLPLLYLHGLSSGDFVPALAEFFGSDAGLSASTITRRTTSWQAEHAEWERREVAAVDCVYYWVDGVHTRMRLEEDRLCCLVIVGVRLDGTKELVAARDGYRESTESQAQLLRDLRERGLEPPAVAVGDGALGFWAALRDVSPQTREQRCWVNKTANVLDALPKRLRAQARAAPHGLYEAEGRARARPAARWRISHARRRGAVAQDQRAAPRRASAGRRRLRRRPATGGTRSAAGHAA
jgi:transposase-like protein